MTDLERYILEENVEDFLDGIINRRELLRRATLVLGTAAAANSFLVAAGCGPGAQQSAPPSPAPAAGATPQPFATPPPQATTDGVTVKPSDSRIKVESAAVTGFDGAQFISYLARPANGPAKVPGVLVIHENQGLKEHIRDVVRRVATAGFAGLSIDLLSRQGGADKLSNPGDYSAALARLQTGDMIADERSAIAFLKSQPYVDGSLLGATGFCFGGGMVWSLLAAGVSLKAAVPFYGQAPSNIDSIVSNKAAVFAVYAEKDARVTGTKPQAENALKSSGVPYQITVYPGVDHAFHNDTNPARYGPEQAQQAWVATINWFRKYLV
jgi:carboxymethylenebutenolidase